MFATSFRRLALCTAMFSCSLSASATDPALDAYAGHVGRLNGWLLLPEVVLKHCEIHVPGNTAEMRSAFATWRAENKELIDTATSAVGATAGSFTSWLGMTVEQTKEWQRDSTTLIIEEITFWRKDRVQIYNTCLDYPMFLAERHSSKKTLSLMRESLEEINRVRTRRN